MDGSSRRALVADVWCGCSITTRADEDGSVAAWSCLAEGKCLQWRFLPVVPGDTMRSTPHSPKASTFQSPVLRIEATFEPAGMMKLA
jgi:hypothetical protein